MTPNGSGLVALAATKFTAVHYDTIVTLADAATVALDSSLGNEFYLSTAAGRTIGVPSNAPAAGLTQTIHIYVKNTDSGSHTLTLTTTGAGFRFGAEIVAITDIPAGKTNHIIAKWHAVDSRWDVVGMLSSY